MTPFPNGCRADIHELHRNNSETTKQRSGALVPACTQGGPVASTLHMGEGKMLAEVSGTKPIYRFKAGDKYVRAELNDSN